MRNNIVASYIRPNRQNEKVTGLLKRMRADIVAPDGSFPDIHIDNVVSLSSDGTICLSAKGSSKCYLETNLKNVQYYSVRNPYFKYIKRRRNRNRHARRRDQYRFKIKLAGQREKS